MSLHFQKCGNNYIYQVAAVVVDTLMLRILFKKKLLEKKAVLSHF